MTIEPMEMLIAGLGVVTLLSFVLAIAALMIGRRARRRLETFEASVTQLEQAMQSAANIFAESDMRMNAACEQIDQLTVQQGTIAAATGQSGFQQAIALSRRGATAAELVDVCGVSQGEARLIRTMYGPAAESEARIAAN